jgi:hypothetical protein
MSTQTEQTRVLPPLPPAQGEDWRDGVIARQDQALHDAFVRIGELSFTVRRAAEELAQGRLEAATRTLALSGVAERGHDAAVAARHQGRGR